MASIIYAYIIVALQGALGRDPSEKETQDAIAALLKEWPKSLNIRHQSEP